MKYLVFSLSCVCSGIRIRMTTFHIQDTKDAPSHSLTE